MNVLQLEATQAAAVAAGLIPGRAPCAADVTNVLAWLRCALTLAGADRQRAAAGLARRVVRRPALQLSGGRPQVAPAAMWGRKQHRLQWRLPILEPGQRGDLKAYFEPDSAKDPAPDGLGRFGGYTAAAIEEAVLRCAPLVPAHPARPPASFRRGQRAAAQPTGFSQRRLQMSKHAPCILALQQDKLAFCSGLISQRML